MIKPMTIEHKESVMEMMHDFYTSPAVFSNGSEEIFLRDFENCIQDNPFLEGYVFVENEELQGYAMLAKSFSTEFGLPCIWIEDLYFKPAYRGKGIGVEFLKFVEDKYPNTVLRLEAEEENERAVYVYRKQGYDVLPYLEMKKINKRCL